MKKNSPAALVIGAVLTGAVVAVILLVFGFGADAVFTGAGIGVALRLVAWLITQRKTIFKPESSTKNGQ
jgi:hypothetical protein